MVYILYTLIRPLFWSLFQIHVQQAPAEVNVLIFTTFFIFFNFFIYTETTSDNMVFIVAPVR